jgi:hypothetical protein
MSPLAQQEPRHLETAAFRCRAQRGEAVPISGIDIHSTGHKPLDRLEIAFLSRMHECVNPIGDRADVRDACDEQCAESGQ